MDLDKLEKKGDLMSTLQGKGSLRHVQAMVQPDTSADQLLSHIRSIDLHASSLAPPTADGSKEEGTGFVLTGLHPCGDLSATMLRMFAESKEIVGVVCVGCCYMKLTTGPAPGSTRRGVETREMLQGYPMSRFMRGCGHSLSYEARELACHSIASYVERFKGETETQHCRK